MKSLEFTHNDNAYRVHYGKRDESYDDAFGRVKDHSWVIMFVEIWCPVLTKNEWLNLDLTNIEEAFLERALKKIEEANGE